MKNENITGGFKKLKQDLAGMTFKQKVEHLWTYYRSWVVVAIAIVMLISIFATSIIRLSTKTVGSGVCVNVPLADGAEEYLKSSLEAQLITGNGRERMYFKTDYTDPSDQQNNINLIQSIQSLVASKDLDYMILDDHAVALLRTQGLFMNLETFLTPEELALFKEQGRLGAIDGVTVLVDVTDWPVVKQNANSEKHYYFVVIANTPRLEAARAAFNLLQLYGAEE